MTNKEKIIESVLKELESYVSTKNGYITRYLTKPIAKIIQTHGYKVEPVDMEGLYRIYTEKA